MRDTWEAAFAVAFIATVALVYVLLCAVLSGQSKDYGAAERQTQIEACEAEGGIPVVIAGVLSSRGIGCAQPLGD